MKKEVDYKLKSLEDILGHFIVSSELNYKRLVRSQENLHQEMQDFKGEMKVFKDEMAVFKDEMAVFKDEMAVFKDEMKDYKNATLVYQERADKAVAEMKKQYGDLSIRLGTLVEDFVLPNIKAIFQQLAGIAPNYTAGRLKILNSLDPSRQREFDAVAIGDKYLLLNSTKSKPSSDAVKEFDQTLKDVFDYFPEHAGKKLLPVFASLFIPEELVKFLTKRKIYAMALSDDTMQILNPQLKL